MGFFSSQGSQAASAKGLDYIRYARGTKSAFMIEQVSKSDPRKLRNSAGRTESFERSDSEAAVTKQRVRDRRTIYEDKVASGQGRWNQWRKLDEHIVENHEELLLAYGEELQALPGWTEWWTTESRTKRHHALRGDFTVEQLCVFVPPWHLNNGRQEASALHVGKIYEIIKHETTREWVVIDTARLQGRNKHAPYQFEHLLCIPLEWVRPHKTVVKAVIKAHRDGKRTRD